MTPAHCHHHDAGASDPGQGMMRAGHVLAMNRFGATFPDRCVVCNQPANGYRVTKTLYWHPPAVYFAILAGVLIYAIIALIVRKEASVSFGLCPEHKKRRHTGFAIAW